MKLSDIDKLITTLDFGDISIDIDRILNEDALLDLPYSTKILYKLFASGASDKEIQRATGIPLSSIVWGRYDFWEKSRSAVAWAILAREMTKAMPPKRTNRKSHSENEDFLVIGENEELDDNGDLIRVGLGKFEQSKFKLHEEGNALRHCSIIILVGWLDPAQGNSLSFFVANEVSKLYTTLVKDGREEIVLPSHVYQIPGGHVERQDCDFRHNDYITHDELEKAYSAACLREAREEIYFRHQKRSELNESDFIPLWTDDFDSDGSDIKVIGRNWEKSKVYLLKYTGKGAPGDVRFRDKWKGAWITDGVAKKDWIAKSQTYESLLEDYRQAPSRLVYYDALARCLERISGDPELLDRIIRFLL